MSIEINFKNLDKTQAELLRQFFNSKAQIHNRLWKKDTVYKNDEGIEIKFSHDLFQRERKNPSTGSRYEVISNKLIGEGSYGQIKLVRGTLALNNAEDYRFKKQDSYNLRRVVKIQTHTPEKNTLLSLDNEYELTKMVQHLAIKKPTAVEIDAAIAQSYMVMRKLPGKELFQIIIDEYETPRLTVQQRIDLTKALLVALKEQVTDLGIIHCDIKGENVIANLDPLRVNLIDYGLSVKADKLDGKSKGTWAYTAPEVLDTPDNITAKADVYSLGRVLAIIWGVDMISYHDFDPSKSMLHSSDYPIEYLLKDLFYGVDKKELGLENAGKVRILLMAMMRKDPKERISVDAAIEYFSTVNTQIGDDKVLTTSSPSPTGLESLQSSSSDFVRTIGSDSSLEEISNYSAPKTETVLNNSLTSRPGFFSHTIENRSKNKISPNTISPDKEAANAIEIREYRPLPSISQS